MNEDKNKKKELDKKLDSFLEGQEQQECQGEECIIKTDKSLVERINKKIVTDAGRALVM
jgi:hypothetical protein